MNSAVLTDLYRTEDYWHTTLDFARQRRRRERVSPFGWNPVWHRWRIHRIIGHIRTSQRKIQEHYAT
jgi:hypothetical protein